MKDLFLPYELAVIAKEKGFNEPCFCYYDSDGDLLTKRDRSTQSGIRLIDCHSLNTLAPLYQQIVDWFREKHKILIYQLPTISGVGTCFKVNDTKYDQTEPGQYVKTIQEHDYYEALNVAITEAFTLIP